MMDLSSPLDQQAVEWLGDSVGRVQAYLTLRNLSTKDIDSVSGQVLLMDFAGEASSTQPLYAGGLHAPGRQPFTLCILLDGLGPFDSLCFVPQRVEFADGGVWQETPEELVLCKPDLLPPGPERVALVAVAGNDAVCWPRSLEHAWVCVCGRFNAPTQRFCRHCDRDGRETLSALKPESVMAAYQQQQAAARLAQADLRQEANQRWLRFARRRHRDYLQRKKHFITRSRLRRGLWYLAGGGALGGLILWAVQTIR